MKVAVIGAGTMGAGIAQSCALAGHTVTLQDVSEAARTRGLSSIESSLARLVKKGTVSAADSQTARTRVTPAEDVAEVGDAEIIIEAVFENVELKKEVWKRLSEVANEGALLATNTSSLSITEIASSVKQPERFCGMHFFNPVPVLPLVEIVRALQTTESTMQRAKTFVEGIGKTPILCDDKPGFVVNRLLIPYLNDAVHALSEGVASAEDIDSAMKLGANMPIGPLALIDLVGLDVSLAAAESLYHEFQDPRFRIPPLLRQLVRAGKLGRKTGEGFYKYES